MRKEPTGYAVIEFNHSGIPDNELKPEEFTPRQEAVLRALQKDRQAQIRRGCPVAVIDMATGDRIIQHEERCAFGIPEKPTWQSRVRGSS